MAVLIRPWGSLHYQIDGPAQGGLVVFGNSLGTDLRLWDKVLPLLPQDLRYVRFDFPGHGLTDTAGDVSMASMADDVAALIESQGKRAVFVGLSIGGLVGQALAAARPDLLRALVLSNTAAKLGTAESWQMRIDAVRAGGLAQIADGILERWFTPAFRQTPELALWRNMLVRTPADGYIASCRALAAADQTDATAKLRLPTLVIACSADGASPPEMVETTAKLIAKSEFHLIADAGHLPCVEKPEIFARIVSAFLKVHCLD